MKNVLSIKNCNIEIWNVRLFAYAIIIKGANLTFQITDIIPEEMEQIVFFAMISCFVFSLIKNIKYINLPVIVITTVISVMYFIAYINDSNIVDDIIKRFVWSVIIGMPCLWCISKISNVKLFLELMKPYSYVFTVLGSLIFFGDTGVLSSNMAFSGMMLFPFCLHFCYALNKDRISLIILLYEMLIIFAHGSRGGLFSMLMFIVLYFFVKGLTNIKILQRIIVAIPFILIVLFIVVTNLSDLLGALTESGIYIRNLDFLVNQKFLDDNGRDAVQSDYLDLIFNSSPIRLLIVDSYNKGTEYPHNIFIEVLYNYGYFLGGLLIAVFLVSLLRYVITLKREKYDLLMILLCSGLFPLLTSFTYSEWPLFWGLVGCLISQCNRNNKSGEW